MSPDEEIASLRSQLSTALRERDEARRDLAECDQTNEEMTRAEQRRLEPHREATNAMLRRIVPEFWSKAWGPTLEQVAGAIDDHCSRVTARLQDEKDRAAERSDALNADRDNLSAQVDFYKSERDAALARAESAEGELEAFTAGQLDVIAEQRDFAKTEAYEKAAGVLLAEAWDDGPVSHMLRRMADRIRSLARAALSAEVK